MKRLFVAMLWGLSMACGSEAEAVEATDEGSSGSTSVEVSAACEVDADCVLRTEAQCSCGVAPADAPPLPPPSEACFADPCMRSVARCVTGQCTVADSP
ncbi:MAG: hypothetical protein H6720_03835 [Sandaracinus sp.]|nr:hypothetical protein [Myxococcales bacterium]MCB9599480.1 hypothetical protein [Sandaracinus sp.]MCB9621765.1 hypothetical protein [Sandaracinus sp.]